MAPHGGVLAVAGDDPGAKSSSLAHQSEPAFIAAGMPVVYPATLQDVVMLGLHAWEMSRVSGCWVGFKVVTELMDSSASIDLAATRSRDEGARESSWRPVTTSPGPGRRSPWRRAWSSAACRWRRPSGGSTSSTACITRAAVGIGIVASGRAYLEVREALSRMGVDEDMLDQLGLRIYQVSLVWPLEPAGAAEFALGLRDLLVVEEKQPLIEEQLARYLYAHATARAWPGRKTPTAGP